MTDNDRLELSSTDRAIDRFLAGEMPEAERAAFEALIINDPEAAELLEAERLIQVHQSNTVRSVGAEVAVPNALLLQYLSRTKPRRQWPAYLFAGIFAMLLVGVLYFTANAPKQDPPLAKPSVVKLDSTKVAPVEQEAIPQSAIAPTVSVPSIANKQAVRDSMPTKPSSLQIEEPNGPMKTYTNDKLPFKIHSN